MSFTNYRNHRNVHISTNPFVKVLVDRLRKKESTSEDYFFVAKKLCYYLAFSAMEKLSLRKEKSVGWTGDEIEIRVPNEKFVIVPVLRAGLSMLHSTKEVFGDYATVSFIDYERDEKTLIARENYRKMSNLEGHIAIILDPMLATGGTLESCIETLKRSKCDKIISLSIISAPEGIERVVSKHSDVEIYTIQLDEKLNEHGFILPGLGDFGDRTFGGYQK